jgi:hypothetical protein
VYAKYFAVAEAAMCDALPSANARITTRYADRAAHTAALKARAVLRKRVPVVTPRGC